MFNGAVFGMSMAHRSVLVQPNNRFPFNPKENHKTCSRSCIHSNGYNSQSPVLVYSFLVLVIACDPQSNTLDCTSCDFFSMDPLPTPHPGIHAIFPSCYLSSINPSILLVSSFFFFLLILIVSPMLQQLKPTTQNQKSTQR